MMSTSGAPDVAATSAEPVESSAPSKPPARVGVRWAGDHRFDAGRPGGPPIRLDASGATGPGPVDGLLASLAACISVDVVDILAKRRTPVLSLSIDVTGTRAATVPARITAVQLDVQLDGDGIERVHAERAFELAVTKYCSVRDSLDRDIPVAWAIVLNGVPPDA